MVEKARAFGFRRYWFDRVSISSGHYDRFAQVRLGFDIKASYVVKESKVTISFRVKVFSGEKADYFCAATCFGEFRFKDVSRKEDIPDYFYSNSIAILFPYLRAFVSLLTMQANFGEAVVLPLLNFTSVGKTIKDRMSVID